MALTLHDSGSIAPLVRSFSRQGFGRPDYSVGGTGVMPVAVIFAASSLALVIGSLLSRPPDSKAVERFFLHKRVTGP